MSSVLESLRTLGPALAKGNRVNETGTPRTPLAVIRALSHAGDADASVFECALKTPLLLHESPMPDLTNPFRPERKNGALPEVADDERYLKKFDLGKWGVKACFAIMVGDHPAVVFYSESSSLLILYVPGAPIASLESTLCVSAKSLPLLEQRLICYAVGADEKTLERHTAERIEAAEKAASHPLSDIPGYLLTTDYVTIRKGPLPFLHARNARDGEERQACLLAMTYFSQKYGQCDFEKIIPTLAKGSIDLVTVLTTRSVENMNGDPIPQDDQLASSYFACAPLAAAILTVAADTSTQRGREAVDQDPTAISPVAIGGLTEYNQLLSEEGIEIENLDEDREQIAHSFRRIPLILAHLPLPVNYKRVDGGGSGRDEIVNAVACAVFGEAGAAEAARAIEAGGAAATLAGLIEALGASVHDDHLLAMVRMEATAGVVQTIVAASAGSLHTRVTDDGLCRLVASPLARVLLLSGEEVTEAIMESVEKKPLALKAPLAVASTFPGL